MKVKHTAVMVVLLVFSAFAFAQDTENEKKEGSLGNYWQVGAGFNAVDDTGLKLRQYFDVNDNWHIAPHPSLLSGGYFWESGLGVQLIGTYNKYKIGKIVDGRPLTDERDYFALDTKISYDLNKVFGETGWFDPYVAAGGGFTSVGDNDRPTFNTGVGFNIWFTDRWGVNFDTHGKVAMKEGATNHLQHSVSVVYRFLKKKKDSIQQPEEIKPIEEVIAEETKDTLPTVDEEALKKAQQEALARAAAEERKKQLLDKLNDIGEIYFDFDSSYLTPGAKAQLDKLIALMNEYPEISILAGSHADVRGTDAYNNWLTERRANRVKEYLLAKGINSSRIESNGYGESQIRNQCTNGVKCSEADHRFNRRSQFQVKE